MASSPAAVRTAPQALCDEPRRVSSRVLPAARTHTKPGTHPSARLPCTPSPHPAHHTRSWGRGLWGAPAAGSSHAASTGQSRAPQTLRGLCCLLPLPGSLPPSAPEGLPDPSVCPMGPCLSDGAGGVWLEPGHSGDWARGGDSAARVWLRNLSPKGMEHLLGGRGGLALDHRRVNSSSSQTPAPRSTVSAHGSGSPWQRPPGSPAVAF